MGKVQFLSLTILILFMGSYSSTAHQSLFHTTDVISSQDLVHTHSSERIETPSPDQTSSNPVNAILGLNNGSISTEGESYYFLQYVTSEYSYEYSLEGPLYTDFDLGIYDSNDNLLAEALSSSYPDTTTLSGHTGNVSIIVSSYQGTGDFTLEIRATNDTTPDELVATLGVNYGFLDYYYEDTVYMTFYATVGQWYEFILNGPEDTDFDFVVYSDYSYEDIAYGDSVTYPDYGFGEADASVLTIEIYTYEGSGEFSLTINEISEPNLNPNLGFSSSIISGDTHYWYIDESRGFEDDVGDTFVLKPKFNGPDIDILFEDYYYGYSLSTYFTFTYQGSNALDEWDLFMFLLPVSFEIFENEPLGVYEMVLLLYNGYVYQSGNIVTVEYSDGWSFYISLSYDATSGLMQKMVLEDTYENDYARILYTHDKNAIPEGLDFIPLMSVIAILLVLPIFKRYKRYS